MRHTTHLEDRAGAVVANTTRFTSSARWMQCTASTRSITAGISVSCALQGTQSRAVNTGACNEQTTGAHELQQCTHPSADNRTTPTSCSKYSDVIARLQHPKQAGRGLNQSEAHHRQHRQRGPHTECGPVLSNGTGTHPARFRRL